jgi:tRNA(Ile)-lysidine synthase
MTGPGPDPVARFRHDLASTGVEPGILGIAVSGGPDSLALLLLAAAAFPGAVAAATVDHRLRPESAAEAAFVADLCAGRGIPHAILADDAPLAGNVQSAARNLRYRLLAGWAQGAGIAWLLTAHHQDDQAETLLMRLQRGAGLAGLAGIRAATRIAGVAVARPLLGWSRAELAAIVAGAGIVPVEDPSNRDERYDRARFRRRIAEAGWIDAAALARSAGALGEADIALDWALERLLEERLQATQSGFTFDPQNIPAELRRRALLRILFMLAPAAPPPRGDAVQRLLTALEAGQTATLAGVKCEGGPRWRFTPARARTIK